MGNPMERFGQFWQKNKVAVVMGGIVVGGHLTWRWIQEQPQLVPAGTQKEYPWYEAAKHVQVARNATNAAGSNPDLGAGGRNRLHEDFHSDVETLFPIKE